MKGKRELNRGRMVWAAVLLPLLLTACGATSYRQAQPVTHQPARVEVPDVEGLAVAKARRALRHAGFRLGRVEEQPVRRYAPGTVLEQYPAPYAAAKAGSSVDLVVAIPREAARVAVPDLTGRQIDAAKRALRKAGLRLGQVRERKSGRARPGAVLRQDPEPWSRIPAGSHVDIVLARAERQRDDDDDDDDYDASEGYKDHEEKHRTVAVPDVTGLSLNRAEKRLSAAKLRLGRVTKRAKSGVAVNTVLAQTPKRGRVKTGGKVDLVVVAKAKVKPAPAKPQNQAKLRKVPSLTGLDIKAAEDRLRKAGLRLGPVTFARDGGEVGQIVGQRQPAGSKVKAGTRITVVVVEPRD